MSAAWLEHVLAELRKVVTDLQLENSELHRQNNRLAVENNDLCDRIFELEQRLGLPAFPTQPQPEPKSHE